MKFISESSNKQYGKRTSSVWQGSTCYN